MTIEKMPRNENLEPCADIKRQLQTSFCNLLKSDESSGCKLYQIMYGFVIYNGYKNELWKIKAEVTHEKIESVAFVKEYAEKQFFQLTQKNNKNIKIFLDTMQKK